MWVCVCVKGGSVFVGKGEGGMNGCVITAFTYFACIMFFFLA